MTFRSCPVSVPASAANSIRSTTRPDRTWNTWTMAPLGPTFTPNTSRSPNSGLAIFCWRSRMVCTVRIASRKAAASSKRSPPAASIMRACSWSASSWLRPSRNSRVSATAWPYRSAEQIAATHGARQRLMSYSRQGRPRSPVITSLQDRMPEQLVGQPHRPPGELGRQEGPGVEVPVALDGARDQHARERLAGGELQVGVVLVVTQQDVVAGRALLDQVVLERQRLHHRVGHDHGDSRRSRRAGRRSWG